MPNGPDDLRYSKDHLWARLDYASVADFADPDGNAWVVQEIGYRPPPAARLAREKTLAGEG